MTPRLTPSTPLLGRFAPHSMRLNSSGNTKFYAMVNGKLKYTVKRYVWTS